MAVRAVFLDKDGMLVEDVPYNVDPARLRLTRGAAAGLRVLRQAGFRLVVVSNQSGIARGFFSEQRLDELRRGLQDLLASQGVELDGFFYCPHAPPDRCACRKPAPGLLRSAARDLGLELKNSWLVGDILDDVEAGRRAGCRTVLLTNGGETQWRAGRLRRPHAVASDLEAAARLIVSGAP